ncbi:MAG: aldehyde dehydrogenase family protein [Planctomycetes bacterium]|nr:aldehyde dehydrogenase family protein [Planctomycetota bacterium]
MSAPPIDHGAAVAEARLGGVCPMLIAGEACLASDGVTLPAVDPSTGLELSRFPRASDADVDRAVGAARRAFDTGPWSGAGPAARATALHRLADLCKERQGELTLVESLDVGMPRTLARRLSLGALVRNLHYYAEWADKVHGEVPPLPSGEGLDYTRREPVGVVAAVYPWNVPLLFVGSKLGPALATGNVVILKPSEAASLSALRVASWVGEAGFPEGVVQVVSGDGATGEALVSHPGVDLVSFTGGVAVARRVLAAAATGPRRTLLELGGKSPSLIFADADLAVATTMTGFGAFGLGGQTCAAASRVLVQRGVYGEVLERFGEFAAGLPLGDPLEGTTLLGPLVSQAHRERVLGWIRRGVEEGARLHLQVEVPAPLRPAGAFLGPAVFAEVDPDMAIAREEVFGPVVCLASFEDEDEAVALANRTEYGLAAAVWTRDLRRAHRVASRIRAGTVWVNTYGTLPPTAPFGGMKRSGWGREGGRDALLEYTQTKNVMVAL